MRSFKNRWTKKQKDKRTKGFARLFSCPFVLFSVCLFAILSFFAFAANAAVDLTGSAFVEKSASTAAIAKKNASDDAARNVFVQVLSRYSDKALIENLAANVPTETIANMIASTTIEGERQGSTVYSAKFIMTLDRAAAEDWMLKNNLPNYMAAADGNTETSLVFLEIGGLRDWIGLARTLRESGLKIDVKNIFGRQITANIPADKRREFIAAVRANGWIANDSDGILRVFK